MAWDSTRPVPWERLAREWLIYVGVMGVIFVAFFRDRPLLGIFAGLLVSGPLYLGFGYVLAKFGYQRRSWKQLRDERPDPAEKRSRRKSDGSDDSGDGSAPRPKPAPTKRTGGGGSQRPGGARKRRR